MAAGVVQVTNHTAARPGRPDGVDPWLRAPALGRAWTFVPSSSVVLARHPGALRAHCAHTGPALRLSGPASRHWYGHGTAAAVGALGTSTWGAGTRARDDA
jgi:hypothetical protein